MKAAHGICFEVVSRVNAVVAQRGCLPPVAVELGYEGVHFLYPDTLLKSGGMCFSVVKDPTLVSLLRRCRDQRPSSGLALWAGNGGPRFML